MSPDSPHRAHPASPAAQGTPETRNPVRPLTDEQQAAVAAEGNVVVVAGAGTGKTRTLVERCLALVTRTQDPVALDAILMVTFTEAAAAEMRQRLREALAARAALDPTSPWLAEQLTLLDAAPICTLHSFCLRLVREHFLELELDPTLSVLAQDQSRLLARDTLDTLLRRHYEGQTPQAQAVQELVLDYGRGWDRPIRNLIFRIHEYAQTLRDPGDWFRQQAALLDSETPVVWEHWLSDGFHAIAQRWLPVLAARNPTLDLLQPCADALSELPPRLTRSQLATRLDLILAADQKWPRGSRTKMTGRLPFAPLFEEATFLSTLARPSAEGDPLAEDWRWCRQPMRALLELTAEFGRELDRAKRELAALDFHDLEQLALRLLWDPERQQPTPVARRCQERLRCIFVDEYQDINEAQDLILQTLARQGANGNRFLVGDVKQSIYRFRRADPRIFQRYIDPQHPALTSGRVLPLTRNFRSHPGVLHFVNRLFRSILHREIGGVEYPPDQWLQPGPAPVDPTANPSPQPAVELHLAVSDSRPANDASDPSTDREATIIAQHLEKLFQTRLHIHDRETGQPREIRWGDMAILLRSPRHQVDGYARAFTRHRIPLQIAGGGFFETLEISDFLQLFRLLDNPLQDRPLAAVLRSPLVGLTPEELATIRVARRRSRFWSALLHFHQGTTAPSPPQPSGASPAPTHEKVGAFLRNYARWRELSRVAPLSECFETILDDTAYEAWLEAEPRGPERRANLRRLLELSRQFDQFQRQGLHRFLQFVESRQDLEIDLEPAAPSPLDAVQLLSIHQSKGLEFPVVVVAGLGNQFNLEDLRQRVILDEVYGLCPQIQPPACPRRYPSLPWWLAKGRQHRETLGEELRLLYVAFTRARDRLLLTGTVRTTTIAKHWTQPVSLPFTPNRILQANRPLDWIGPWLTAETSNTDWSKDGQTPWLAWHIHDTANPPPNHHSIDPKPDIPPHPQAHPAPDLAGLAQLRSTLAWTYPATAATRLPAKASVSTLRRHAIEESSDESNPLFPFASSPAPYRRSRPRTASELTPTEVGAAHHRVLETLPLTGPVHPGHVLDHVRQLRDQGWLSDAEMASINLHAISRFWQSAIGHLLLSHAHRVQRELPFTARFSPADLHAAGCLEFGSLPPEDYLVVQGVADLVVILPDQLWVLDFKTDRASEEELPAKIHQYHPQLALYALALGRIYRRPVSRRWLHFLASDRTVELPAAGYIPSCSC